MKYIVLFSFSFLSIQFAFSQSCTIFNFENFETDFGIWNCGFFCKSSTDIPGIFGEVTSIELQGSSVTQSTLQTDPFDMSSYDSVGIEFALHAINTDGMLENLFIDISTDGGTTFTSEVTQSTFTNNAWTENQIFITSSNFGPNTVVRFRSDISGSKRFYIDRIAITRCSSAVSQCFDGIKNGDETGVDCGGPTCNLCPCDGANLTIVTVVSDLSVHLSNNVNTIANGSISNNATVCYNAKNSIDLNPEFRVDLGVSALFNIEDCIEISTAKTGSKTQ